MSSDKKMIIDKPLQPFGAIHHRRYLTAVFDPAAMRFDETLVFKLLGVRQTRKVGQVRISY